ncbi:S-adenosylmethionine-dependent methyltransferase Rv2258c-like [Glandiceps talaboti]
MASKEAKPETNEEFKSRIHGVLSSGFLSIGLAIGSAAGLFQTMSRLGEPKTSSEIAREANKKERYVREWLAGMVTGRIIDYNPEEETYFISPSRLDCLLGGQAHANVSRLVQMVPGMCEAYNDVLHCMDPEGPSGVPYSAYKSFSRLMNEISITRFSGSVPDFIRDMDDVMANLESGISVCDIGCGKGTAILELAKAFPKSTFYGIDFAEAEMQEAQLKAAELKLSNLTYCCYDAAKLPSDWSEKFKLLLSIDSIHDQARPDLALEECYRVLKSEGYFIVIDVDSHTKLSDNLDNPGASIFYVASLMHCMPVSLYFDGGFGLGNMWGMEKAVSMFEDAKFTCERHFHLEGTAERVFVCRKILK